MKRSAAVSAAVMRASRSDLRGQDALATAGKVPALRKAADLPRPGLKKMTSGDPIGSFFTPFKTRGNIQQVVTVVASPNKLRTGRSAVTTAE